MTDGKLRIGIVGCGVVTRRHHVPAILKNPSLEIGRIYDVAPGVAEDLRGRFGLSCPASRDLDELLDDDTLDLVNICTPGPLHFEQACHALERGRNILLEKPPLYTLEEWREVADRADRWGRKVGVIFNNRYRNVVQELKSHLDSGRIGMPVKVHITHHANLVYSESPWLWDQKSSKYLVYEFGIHHFDMLVYLFGEHESVVSVIASGQRFIPELITDIHVTVRFRSGVLATIDITQDSTRHSTYFSKMEVFGTAADALVRFFPPMVRLTAGMEHPVQILWTEMSSFMKLAFDLATRRYFQGRNRGHEEIFRMLAGWLRRDETFPLDLRKVLPTVRLLHEISERIPAYCLQVLR